MWNAARRVVSRHLWIALADGSVRPGNGGVNDFLVYLDFSRRL